jgi:hypothetical protein
LAIPNIDLYASKDILSRANYPLYSEGLQQPLSPIPHDRQWEPMTKSFKATKRLSYGETIGGNLRYVINKGTSQRPDSSKDDRSDVTTLQKVSTNQVLNFKATYGRLKTTSN